MPNGFGTGKGASNGIMLSPLNKDCQKICKRECEAFSRKFKPYKMLNPNSIYAEIFSIELNEDVILNCYSTEVHHQKQLNHALIVPYRDF